MGNWSWDWLLA